MAKGKTCKGCAYMLTICKDGKVLGWCCELSDVPTTEDSEACTEFDRDEAESEKQSMSEGMIREQATERLRDVLQGMAEKLCEQCRSILETAIEEAHSKALKDSEAEPCKDTISRQASIEAIRKDPMGGLNYEGILTRLPPVTSQPKTGHWIEYDDSAEVQCDKCGRVWSMFSNEVNTFLYCPACGAKMDEPQKREDEE